MELFEVTFRPNGTLSENSLACARHYAEQFQIHEGARVFYIAGTANDSVRCTINVDPVSHASPMSKVHSMALNIHTLVVELISRADRQFEVTARVDEQSLQSFMNAVTQDESVYDSSNYTRIESNRQTIRDIAAWMREMGPFYNQCFITPDMYKEKNALFNTQTLEFQSVEEALGEDNTSIVIVGPREKGVVNVDNFRRLARKDVDSGRWACKVQGSLAPDNLHNREYIDLKKAALQLNHFVTASEYVLASTSKKRIFAIIPSFEKYAGLVSDEVMAGESTISAMHCGIDPGKTYQMSFIFACGVSPKLRIPDGRSCVSNGRVYKTPAEMGACHWPTSLGRDLDAGCCVAPHDEKFLKMMMVMYARKTMRDRNYSFLENTYQWYIENNGAIKPHDAKVWFQYPASGDGMHMPKAFLAMRPAVKVLHIFAPDALNLDTATSWYDKVNSAFKIEDQFIVKLSYIPRDGETIDVEHMKRVISARPKSELHFELGGAYFGHIINDLRGILDAIHQTENFFFSLFWAFNEITRDKDPTNAIVNAGFLEDEDQQSLQVDEDDPDDYNHTRVFEKDHMKVSMWFQPKIISLELRTGHAFS